MATSVMRPAAVDPCKARAGAATVAAHLAAFASDAERCAALLSGSLTAFRDGTASLLDLRIGDAIAGRRGKAFLTLETRIRTHASGEVRAQTFVLQFFADDDGRKVLWRMRRRVPAASMRGFACYVPDQRILIHEFPFDYRLETLADACSPPLMRARLASLAGDPSLAVDRIDVVRYVPEKRCLLRYLVTVKGQQETWLGKVYAHDDDLVSGAIQRSLHEACPAGSAARVPAVIGVVRDLRLVLQRHVDGTPVYESLRAGTLTREHLAATARALATMHAAPLAVSRRHTWHDELEVARSAIARSALADDVRGRASQVAAALATAVIAHRWVDVPVHRDFYDKQVLVTPDGVTLIDFDTTCASYPELDIANFVAHLLLRSMQGYVQQERAGDHARTFLAAYLAHNGAVDPTRYRVTLATTWLRLAAVYAMRPLWRQLSASLVDLAERAARAECPADPILLTHTLCHTRHAR